MPKSSSHAASAASGVLGQAHSQVRVSDQEICPEESLRKLLYFKRDKRRSATTERHVSSKMRAHNRPQGSFNVPKWGPNSQHQSGSQRRRASIPMNFASEVFSKHHPDPQP